MFCEGNSTRSLKHDVQNAVYRYSLSSMVLNYISYTSYSESERMKKYAPVRKSTNQGETTCDKFEIIVSVHTPTRSPRLWRVSCVENEACSGFQVTLIRSDELKLNAKIIVTW